MRSFTISKHGFSTIGFFLIGALISWFINQWLMLTFLCFATFTAAFFRNPKRFPPQGEEVVVSPADGKVMEVDEVIEPNFTNNKMKRVRIFLSLFNVHMNRMPIDGNIAGTSYLPGKYLLAWKDKVSDENERNAILIDHYGSPFVVVQIAGFVARRIVSQVTEGQAVTKGDLFGMIKFGSCTELYLPMETVVKVKSGDKVKAGETILAEMPEKNKSTVKK
ncbi:phosphatidylserine decarboxylase family protein [Natranaerobius thermophilus]|uniref:Phosphatidylserine decarboxylase proenzyme n=1 Tax=Natranaerobius thermophilus (strain ATCC BAA-1301 / DSM 18059 / JW/NM-WN-LF) TaxID=457570 RepID=B2A6D9_NATTJ|nr:phosphatidylserine decarboxylase family protein [Natranaerobius thermophilus]ACB84150.1 phosphatidylserine decarboxylase related protein [Natranaerobius thermophilus JW/NM-WN-LF]